ncbi:hypothetical protein ACQWU4_09545 [Chryseobacterium sp. MIQD13]|uniref:hypothetical protein n=1 Tax=Chryseobacterium sp. MIQD13 TaxID=3422310 RepID=UPI003D2A0E3D
MKKIKLSFLLVGLMAFTACEKEKEDEVKNVDKNGSIETVLSVEHLDAADILITKHKIWKNKKLFKEIVKKDTIPSLGDTLVGGEDNDGNSHIVKTKKDYEFFITVQ